QNYLSLGFTYTAKEEEPRPLCVVCCEILSNESMKPAHLRHHFTTKHVILRMSLLTFSEETSTIRNSAIPVSKAQEASYHTSLRIAKAGKPHTFGEELWLPFAKVLMHTVTRRISDMVDDVRSTLIECIKMSRCFSLQLDEFTDVADFANLHVYIRYEFEGMSHEDFMFCKPLPPRTIQGSIFLMKLFELHSEVQMLLHDQKSPLASLFDDPVWQVQLAYLADIQCIWKVFTALHFFHILLCYSIIPKLKQYPIMTT
ncbi:ZBED5 protein, partial [Amia calva]|nr:ZBED5 protein [Amia calva]